jgi:hypothetical protein
VCDPSLIRLLCLYPQLIGCVFLSARNARNEQFQFVIASQRAQFPTVVQCGGLGSADVDKASVLIGSDSVLVVSKFAVDVAERG